MEGAARQYRDRVFHALRLDRLSPGARRVVIGIVGGAVALVGAAMLVLPGPAVVVLPLGLAILATEFEWARRISRKARGWFQKAKRSLSRRKRAA